MLPERITIDDCKKFTYEQWAELIANDFKGLEIRNNGVCGTITCVTVCLEVLFPEGLPENLQYDFGAPLP